MFLCIIGSSNIINHHIQCAIKLNIKIFSISSLNKKSKNIERFYKKYKIEKKFTNWKKSIHAAGLLKNCHFLIAPRIIDNSKVFLENNKNYTNKYLKYNFGHFIH